MTTGKTTALTRRTFVCKVMSLLFNMLSRLVITFLPMSKHLLISWLQSSSASTLFPVLSIKWGFPGGTSVKEPACHKGNVRDVGLIPGLGRSPGEGHGNPLQYSSWRILQTEEPGGLQFMGLQRFGHDWGHLAHANWMEINPWSQF